MDVLLELERRRAAGELVRAWRPKDGLLYFPPDTPDDPDDSDPVVFATADAVEAALEAFPPAHLLVPYGQRLTEEGLREDTADRGYVEKGGGRWLPTQIARNPKAHGRATDLIRALALAAITEMLVGCSTTTSNTDVASVSGAFVCGFTDAMLAAAFPDFRFNAPGTTAALVGLPLSYGGDGAKAFADAC